LHETRGQSALVSRLIIDFLKQHVDYLIEEISMPIITWARRHAAFRHDGARPFAGRGTNKSFNKSANERTGRIAGLIPGPRNRTGDRAKFPCVEVTGRYVTGRVFSCSLILQYETYAGNKNYVQLVARSDV